MISVRVAGTGPRPGLLAARSAYIAGFRGDQPRRGGHPSLGIPCLGTMAHSWVQSFATEAEAFESLRPGFPGATTLLVDTYDTLAGVRHAAAIEPPIRAIRLDSGDLARLSSSKARAILDEHGRREVKIFASGDLDEFEIAGWSANGAPIDAFGVGTELITSKDAPALSLVYKLVELNGVGRIKLSPSKKTYPMAKQVFRSRDAAGRFAGDLVTRADEAAEGEPLLVPVVREGKLVAPLPRLDAIQDHCRAQLESLPDRLLGTEAEPDYSISYSDALEAEADRLGVH